MPVQLFATPSISEPTLPAASVEAPDIVIAASDSPASTSRSNKGLILTTKFITKAMAERKDGNAKKYNFIRAQLKHRVSLHKWVRCLKNTISILDNDLIYQIITLPLFLPQTKSGQTDVAATPGAAASEAKSAKLLDLELTAEYSEFLLNLTSFHNCKYSKNIIDQLLHKYFKSERLCVSKTERSPVHALLCRMVKIAPTNLQIVVDCLKANMPMVLRHDSESTQIYIENILHLSDMLPIIRFYIYEYVFNYIILVDAHVASQEDAKNNERAGFGEEKDGDDTDDDDNDAVSLIESDPEFFAEAVNEDDLGGGDSSDESDDESSSEAKKEASSSLHWLNALISLFYSFIDQSRLSPVSASIDPERQTQVFNLLISNTLLLNSIHLKYSPAVIYKMICGNVEYFDYFVSYLVIGLFNAGNKHLVRVNYNSLLTILCRFRFPAVPEGGDDEVWKARYLDTISHTLLLLSQYLHCMLDSASTSQTSLSPIYYHMVTLIMYVFCFHHELLTSSTPERMKWWHIRGGFSRILLSRHQPLEKCTSGIVEEFLSACTRYSLFYYSRGGALAEFGGELEGDGNGGGGDAAGLFVMDGVERKKLSSDLALFYFPFDPHVLDLDIISGGLEGLGGKDLPKECYNEYPDGPQDDQNDEDTDLEH